MTPTRPTVEVVAKQLLEVFPVLDATEQRLSLALYRRLAEGSPVALSALAAELGMPRGEAERRVRDWPGVYYDPEGRVIGYWGLGLHSTAHKLRVAERELHAWCAWDTLFLPALLGQTVKVVSACRRSGQPVELTVSPREVESAQPGGVVVSFLVPDAGAVRADVIASFCHYVHFFTSAGAAQPWLAQHPAAFLLTLDEAYRVGQLRTRARYAAMPDLR